MKKIAGLLALLLSTSVLAQDATQDATPDESPNVLREISLAGWRAGAWNKATGALETSSEIPSAADGMDDESHRITANYSGKGFEFFSIEPIEGAIPGKCQRVSLWARTPDSGYTWGIKFKDAQGRAKVAGKKLERTFKLTPGDWQQLDLLIPSEWEQPLTITSITGHNWNHKADEASTSLDIYGLTVETDISNVKDRSKLIAIQLTSTSERNLFTLDNPCRYNVSIDSWLGKEVTGLLEYIAKDLDGNVVARRKRNIAFTGAHIESLGYTPEKFGIFDLDISLTLSVGIEFAKQMRFAFIPTPHEYTPAEKLASPYGLNIHGGMDGVAYNDIARVGITWVRDYAFKREWTLRAKGDDGKYAGWPWYQKIATQIEESGLMLVPIWMGALKDPVTVDGDLVPNAQWRSDLLHMVMAFPQFPSWELDNEYDLHHKREEEARNWSSYNEYHRVFGLGIHFLNQDTLTVEQGTAGLHPARVRAAIASGAFDEIDVINAHFYCGINPPEISFRNANTGQGDHPKALVFDNLRDLVAAADSDGQDRQTWITEFGWDTLAGHIVSEKEQAAYLQRGYLLGFQAGLDRMFWYWNRDTKEVPNNFFDGCGIFDPKDEPKPVCSSLSALVHFLKLPEPIGTFDLGPNTLGYVFRDQGKLTACAFKIDKELPGPTSSTFDSGEIYNMYGNPLEGRTHTLDIAPIWIVGISEDDPFVLETAFDIKSHYYVRVGSGDDSIIELRVINRQQTPILAEYTVKCDEGCTAKPATQPILVAPGETSIYPITVSVASGVPASKRSIEVNITGSNIQKTLAVTLDIIQVASINSEALSVTPGQETLTAVLKNNSTQPHDFTVTATAPASWDIEPQQQTITAMAPESSQEISFDVNWSTDWTANEEATLAVSTPNGSVVATCPIIPGALTVPAVYNIICDADLSDWPSGTKIPDWALSSTKGAANADVYLAYTTDGIYVAVDIDESGCLVTDPKWFWAQDTLELFIDAANDKTERKKFKPTDHQFWVCPLTDSGEIYAGRWKRDDEIAETQYDLKQITGKSLKTDTGYIMELFIPASIVTGLNLEEGAEIGLNLNINVPSNLESREIYWPKDKSWNIQSKPHNWGTLLLQ